MIALFFVLIGLHAIADYPLQGDFLARLKDSRSPVAQAMGPGSWLHGIINHVAIHGLFVGLATGSLLLGMLESALHAATDLAKVKGRIGFHADQAIHWACKAAWAYAAIEILHTKSPLITG